MSTQISFPRRRFLSASASLATIGLAGCSNSPMAKTVAAFWDQRYGGDRFSREQVEQLPYATLAATLGDTPRAMLVLMRAEGADLHWITADKVVLVTRHGRLVKTVGLAAGNLGNTVMLDADPLSLQGDWRTPRQWRRTVDLQPSRAFGTLLIADWQPEAEEEIVTFYGPRKALRIRERNQTANAGWALENLFWLDAETGATLASLQNIMPDTPSLKLEPLKPYRA